MSHSKLSKNNIGMKMELLFKRKYKEKLEGKEITRKQYKKVCQLIEDRHEHESSEFTRKLFSIFPEED